MTAIDHLPEAPRRPLAGGRAGPVSWCLAVPGPGPGVCPVCCAGTEDAEALCANCRRNARALGDVPAPVTPVSLVTASSPLYAALRHYKDGHPDAAGLREDLASLLAAFLRRHLDCLAPLGVDTVLTVPSTGGHHGPGHPLDDVVRRIPFLPAPVVGLAPGPGVLGHRRADPEALVATVALRGRRVLLLDDTCTSGAHLATAVRAVRRAGARTVHPVVIGRYLQEGWPPSDRILRWAARRVWRADRCARCPGPGPHAPAGEVSWAIMARVAGVAGAAGSARFGHHPLAMTMP